MRFWLAMAFFPLLEAHDTIGYIEACTKEAHFPYSPTITEVDHNNTFISSINEKSTPPKKNEKNQQSEPPNSLYLTFFLPNHYEEKINDLLSKHSLQIEVKQNLKGTPLLTLTPTSLDETLNEKNKMIKYKALITSPPKNLQPGEFFYIHIPL